MNRRDLMSGIIIGSALGSFPSFLIAQNIGKKNAECKSGNFQGDDRNGVLSFKGIRYGTAKRFFAPRAYNYRDEFGSKAQVASSWGNACFQTSKNETMQSEDCLFLNVFTPRLDKKMRPVMFYVHGGAYSNGSSNDDLYDGSALCQNADVVVVTINHRLNAFGYLYLHRLEQEAGGNGQFKFAGNAGQLDIILALKWVRDNIEAFGGNPNNIMAFGQSGGGAKIATLMATPLSEGLFQKAATMSGQQVTASGPGNATKRSISLLNALGLNADSRGLEFIKSVHPNEILAALKTTDPIIGNGGLYMGPVLDEIVLINHPFYPKANGWGKRIPMIIGNTLDETRAFLGGDPANHNLSWDDLLQKLPAQYRVDIDPNLVIETYRKLYPNMTASDVFFAATTAGRSWRGAIIEAEERAKSGSSAYVYQFNYKSKKDDGKWGAAHTIDIPMVFGTLGANSSICDNGTEAKQVSKILSKSFTNFAKSSNPNSDMIPYWKKYSLESRETLLVDINTALVKDPRSVERKLFEKVPFVQQGT